MPTTTTTTTTNFNNNVCRGTILYNLFVKSAFTLSHFHQEQQQRQGQQDQQNLTTASMHVKSKFKSLRFLLVAHLADGADLGRLVGVEGGWEGRFGRGACPVPSTQPPPIQAQRMYYTSSK